MCCRKARNYQSCRGFTTKPQATSLMFSAFGTYLASRAGTLSDNTKEGSFLAESRLPSTNMTLRLRKEEEAAAETKQASTTASTATGTAAATSNVPDEPPPAYQDVIAELPASSTSPRSLSRDASNAESGSDGAPQTTPQQGAFYIPGDNKIQVDAELPQPLQGTLSPAIQNKVDILLSALEEYRRGTGRRLPVRRARRDLLNQLYEDQIKNQENATGARLRPREKTAIWRDLEGLRDDVWVMIRDAKRARRQWI